MVDELERGKHQHPIYEGADEIIDEYLDKAGLPVAGWHRQLGASVKGTAHTPRFKARGPTDQGSVEVKVKPGSNKTATICFLFPPEGVTKEDAFAKLRAVTDREREEILAEREGKRFDYKVESVRAVAIALYDRTGLEKIARDDAWAALSGILEGFSSRGFGKVLAGLEKRGIVVLEKSGSGNITYVCLSTQGLELTPHAEKKLDTSDIETRLGVEMEKIELEILEHEDEIKKRLEEIGKLRVLLEKRQTALAALRDLT